MKRIREFVSEEKTENRVKILKQLHFDSLKEFVNIPVAAGSYYAFTRKPWKAKLSKFYARSPLWQFVRE